MDKKRISWENSTQFANKSYVGTELSQILSNRANKYIHENNADYDLLSQRKSLDTFVLVFWGTFTRKDNQF